MQKNPFFQGEIESTVLVGLLPNVFLKIVVTLNKVTLWTMVLEENCYLCQPSHWNCTFPSVSQLEDATKVFESYFIH